MQQCSHGSIGQALRACESAGMKLLRWIERPVILALLTLVVALVPVWFALRNYREESRTKDEQLFEATSDLIAEKLQLITMRHLNFLNILRNVLRNAPERDQSSEVVPRNLDWRATQPHFIAFGYASNEGEQAIIRWTLGNATALAQEGDDLMRNEPIARALQQSSQSPLPVPVGASLPPDRLFIVDLLQNRNRSVRGYVVGFFDLHSLCQDASVPLLKGHVLMASPLALDAPVPLGAKAYAINEGEVHCRIAIARGPQFAHQFGQLPPVLVFIACILSAVLLALMVMQATRAARLRTALVAEREISRMRSHFIHSVSHEFRTPLSVILSGADLLESHAAQLAPERRAEVFHQIKDSTQRMNEMVEQVLLLGRIESGAMAVNRLPTDLADLCHGIANEVRTATQGRCSIEVQAARELHAVDATLLRSILGNLLTNAVKYSAVGTIVKLQVTATDALRFIISDHGIGIPSEDISRINEPFHRGSNVGEVTGTGLGLAIVESSVKLHGGTLSLDSVEGQGTTITVSLPAFENHPS